MKTLCMSRHMKFLLKATGLNNIAVRTALLTLHDERISLCDSVSVDIDCSLRTFCSAVTSFEGLRAITKFIDIREFCKSYAKMLPAA